MIKNRLNWTDLDWAEYLKCPVQKIFEYRKILNDNYVMVVERNKKTGKYSFAMYRYYITPSGNDRLQLLLSGKQSFLTYSEAVNNANGKISKMELKDFWVKSLNVPKQAIQMMLIREK